MDFRKNKDFLFQLTENQMTALKPLFDKASDGVKNMDKGMILLQPWSDGMVTGGYLPREQALRVINAYEGLLEKS